MDVDDRFLEFAEVFAGVPGVSVPDGTRPRGFGSDTFEVTDSISVVAPRDDRVVECLRDRVGELVAWQVPAEEAPAFVSAAER